MANRDFSDSVKLSVIKDNLRQNSGNICCAICKTKLNSINECHFDHIFPFSKGGKSTVDNCQILCIKCNLKKNDKELHDFILEEKAKQFLAGNSQITTSQNTNTDFSHNSAIVPQDNMSKDEFDQIIQSFIARKGDIHKVDFSREYNHLPSFRYVKKYYGNLNTLKKHFGIEDLSLNWNRETIKKALKDFVDQHQNISQKDLIKKNRLPSLPCILSYYPEYKNFNDIKKKMLNLPVRTKWNKDSVIQAGKDYVAKHGKITESNLRSKNNLPTTQIVYRYFDSLADYQRTVGSVVTKKNEYISENDIENAVILFFGNEDRVVQSMSQFFESFPYSPSTIQKRFGTYEAFCNKYNITVIHHKKAKYTKQEVDDAVAKWIKDGNKIPTSKELRKKGLPSLSVILKYYEDWKEPFVLYRKLYDKLNK